MTAAKLRVQKAREERAEQEPDVEPEVELEEPKEEPAAAEFTPGKEKLITWLGPSAGETLRETLRKNRADHAQEQDEWEAVEKAKEVAYAKEMEEIEASRVADIRMMELDWPAWEQQQAIDSWQQQWTNDEGWKPQGRQAAGDGREPWRGQHRKGGRREQKGKVRDDQRTFTLL